MFFLDAVKSYIFAGGSLDNSVRMIFKIMFMPKGEKKEQSAGNDCVPMACSFDASVQMQLQLSSIRNKSG